MYLLLIRCWLCYISVAHITTNKPPEILVIHERSKFILYPTASNTITIMPIINRSIPLRNNRILIDSDTNLIVCCQILNPFPFWCIHPRFTYRLTFYTS